MTSHSENSAAVCHVIVFARMPVPGEVKSRLVPFLGALETARLYESMVLHSLSTATHSRIGPVELWCTPSSGHPFFEYCAEKFKVRLRLQINGDIGIRMADAFRKTLSPANFAILLGTDSPSVTEQDIRQAAAALRRGADAAFIPVEDGGYCLVGLRRYAPELFSGIDWGTGSVWRETRARLQYLHWTWHELGLRWDVDRPEDIERLESEGNPVLKCLPGYKQDRDEEIEEPRPRR